ncbi:MAG: hypothetical protein Q8J64_04845 [Thermodesulfovibrionales bacterium]|nr:hypothetical protein [Thermodesulfovibrionales bacterium]
MFIALPFLKEWHRVHSLNAEWIKNDRDLATKMILEDIDRAKERMLIYGGNGSIYNDSEILSALKSKKINVEFILENKHEILKNSPLFTVAKEHPNVHLYYAQEKTFKHHFRVIDYSCVYIEQCHEPEADDRMFKRFFNVRFLPGQYSKEFLSLKEQAKLV